MKKQFLAGLTIALTMTTTIPAFGGVWKQSTERPENQNGISNWWYQNDDGSYLANGWYWIDGNQDGWSESYCFDQNGWMYVATTIDQYDVNASGAWMVNGEVQRKASTPSEMFTPSNGTDHNTNAADNTQNQDQKQAADSRDSLSQLTEEGIYEDWAMACFDLINEEREKNGVDPLEFDSDLQKICNIRAKEISEKYDHKRPNGSSWYSLLPEYGIYYGSAGENIYKGPRTAEAAVKGWMDSEGHRKNILKETYQKSAIGFYYSQTGRRYHWVQIFTD